MSYSNSPFNPDKTYANQIDIELTQANTNFTILANAFKNNDPTTGIVNQALNSNNSSYATVAGALVNSNSNNSAITTVLNSPLVIPYSQLIISNTQPSSPVIYTSWYNTDSDVLSYYDGQNWNNVDWTIWVKNDIWYQLGKLKIDNGKLKISNDNQNWFQVYPSMGRFVEVVADDTNSNDNFKKVYLTVGQGVISRGKNIVRVSAVEPSMWNGNYYHTYAGETWFGIYPSNTLITDGVGAFNGGNRATGKNFVPITEQANEQNNWASISIRVVNKKMTTTSVGEGSGGGNAVVCVGYGTFPSNGYFLGRFTYEGNLVNVDYLSITREF
ncbi:MAG: hypothetical protein JHC33_03740 [Ignisphaera sp.]|nr:hypothetical protein [Ignisphaera sp.]